MTDQVEPIDERSAASLALSGATRVVNDSLLTFANWLMAGFGAAFALMLTNIDKVSMFIELRNIRFAVLLFLASIILAVLSNYLSAMVKAGLQAQADGEVLARRVGANAKRFDLELFVREYRRGLFPPISWIAQRSIDKAKLGDSVASARMIAKASQIQTLLVIVQGLLAVVSAGAVALGMKL